MNKNTKNSCTLLCHLFVVASIGVVGACGDDPVEVEPEPTVRIATAPAINGEPIAIETSWEGLCRDDDESYACLPQAYEVSLSCFENACSADPTNQTLALGNELVRVTARRAGDIDIIATLTNTESGDIFETSITVNVSASTTLDRDEGEILETGEPVAGTTLDLDAGEILDDHDVGSSAAIDDDLTLDPGGSTGIYDSRRGSDVTAVRDTDLDERNPRGERPRFAPGNLAAPRAVGNQIR